MYFAEKSNQIMKMYSFKLLTIVLHFVILSNLAAQSRTFLFSCTVEGGHKNVDGSSLDHGAMIALGSFSLGFTPGLNNRSEWSGNWQSLAVTKYARDLGYFEGVAQLSSNAGKFAAGNKIWVWIFNRQGQWCLYSRPTWVWPTIGNGGGPPPVPSYIDVLDAQTVITGSLHVSGSEIQLADNSTYLCPQISYDQWSKLFLTEVTKSPSLDADGDGRSNLEEYALGGDPSIYDSIENPFSFVKQNNVSGFLCKIDKAWNAGELYNVELSGDLVNWQQVESPVNGSRYERFFPFDSHRKFARLSMFLP